MKDLRDTVEVRPHHCWHAHTSTLAPVHGRSTTPSGGGGPHLYEQPCDACAYFALQIIMRDIDDERIRGEVRRAGADDLSAPSPTGHRLSLARLGVCQHSEGLTLAFGGTITNLRTPFMHVRATLPPPLTATPGRSQQASRCRWVVGGATIRRAGQGRALLRFQVPKSGGLAACRGEAGEGHGPGPVMPPVRAGGSVVPWAQGEHHSPTRW